MKILFLMVVNALIFVSCAMNAVDRKVAQVTVDSNGDPVYIGKDEAQIALEALLRSAPVLTFKTNESCGMGDAELTLKKLLDQRIKGKTHSELAKIKKHRVVRCTPYQDPRYAMCEYTFDPAETSGLARVQSTIYFGYDRLTKSLTEKQISCREEE